MSDYNCPKCNNQNEQAKGRKICVECVKEECRARMERNFLKRKAIEGESAKRERVQREKKAVSIFNDDIKEPKAVASAKLSAKWLRVKL